MSDIKEKKTQDMKKYMAEYMRKRYNSNVKMSRLIKQKSLIKSKYSIPDEVYNKYDNYIYNIVKAKQLLNELPPELLNSFFSDFENLHFEIKNKNEETKSDGDEAEDFNF